MDKYSVPPLTVSLYLLVFYYYYHQMTYYLSSDVKITLMIISLVHVKDSLHVMIVVVMVVYIHSQSHLLPAWQTVLSYSITAVITVRTAMHDAIPAAYALFFISLIANRFALKLNVATPSHVQLVPLPATIALSQWQTCTGVITATSTKLHATVHRSAAQ